MDIEIVKKALGESENLLDVIIKLLEILHNNNLDEETIKALEECGVELKIEVKE